MSTSSDREAKVQQALAQLAADRRAVAQQPKSTDVAEWPGYAVAGPPDRMADQIGTKEITSTKVVLISSVLLLAIMLLRLLYPSAPEIYRREMSLMQALFSGAFTLGLADWFGIYRRKSTLASITTILAVIALTGFWYAWFAGLVSMSTMWSWNDISSGINQVMALFADVRAADVRR